MLICKHSIWKWGGGLGDLSSGIRYYRDHSGSRTVLQSSNNLPHCTFVCFSFSNGANVASRAVARHVWRVDPQYVTIGLKRNPIRYIGDPLLQNGSVELKSHYKTIAIHESQYPLSNNAPTLIPITKGLSTRSHTCGELQNMPVFMIVKREIMGWVTIFWEGTLRKAWVRVNFVRSPQYNA